MNKLTTIMNTVMNVVERCAPVVLILAAIVLIWLVLFAYLPAFFAPSSG